MKNACPAQQASRGVVIRVAVVGWMLTAAAAGAAVPTLGGLMNHVNIGIEPVSNPSSGQPTFRFVAGVDDFKPLGETLVIPEGPFDAPYDVLNGKAYNAQYGWLRSGRWGLLPGMTMVIEQVDASPGLEIYEGGLGADRGGTGVIEGSPHSLAPIFGTDGSPTRWGWGTYDSGLTMTHHWVATQTPGPHFATYSLYVRDDATGGLSNLYEPGTVTLRWENPLAFVVGDFDGSGSVEQGDLNLVLNHWGAVTTSNVPDGWVAHLPDGLIDQNELNAVLNNWGAQASPSTNLAVVPEPTASSLMLIGVAVVTRRRIR
ncbi:MAG: hypothetical protein AAGE65_14845 [Planctomycetota bacterium]